MENNYKLAWKQLKDVIADLLKMNEEHGDPESPLTFMEKSCLNGIKAAMKQIEEDTIKDE